MYIPNTPPPSTLTLNTANQANALFKVGQVFSATIETVQGKQVQLNIGNQTLLANTKESIQNTGTVQVQVKQVQPSVVLSIMTPNAPKASDQIQHILQTAYRQLIPQQTNLTQAFQQLSLLQSLPPSLLSPLNQLLDQTLKPGQTLSGKELKNRLEQSGLFLESNLKKNEPPNVKQDIKAQLLALKQQTESLNTKGATPQLLQLTSVLTQAINRLTVQQLQLYENPLITPLELPFSRDRQVYKNSIELRKNEHTSPPSWEVLMDIELPLGNLSTKLTMNHQNEINCFLWCETNALENTIKPKLDNLSQSFADNQLNLNWIQLVAQKPSSAQKTTQVALIDIHI